MATITGLTKLVWTGTSNSNSNVGCEDIQLTDYRNSISKLYVTDQSGSTFTFQRPSEADSGFAPVKEFKCGSAYLIFIKSDAINIPSATPSDLSKNSGLVQLNVPIQIKIQNLTNLYESGNGIYELTTFFQNDAPTYKKINSNWVIQKQIDSNWYLICVQLDLHLNPLIAPFLPLCFQFPEKA